MYFYSKPLLGTLLDIAHPRTMGLVAMWAFNEKAGNRVNDLSLMGKSPATAEFMTMGGTTSGWIGSDGGGGMRFDGTDDYVAVNNNLELQKAIDYDKPFSIVTRFKLEGAGAYGRLIGNEFYVGANGSAWSVDADVSLGIYITVVNIGAGPVQDGRIYRAQTQALSVGKTYTYTVTYNGLNATTSCKVYRNGVPQTVIVQNEFGNASGTVWSADNLAQATTIGARINYPTPGIIDTEFNGIIEEIRIYNRILTEDEAKTFYNAPYVDLKARGVIQRIASSLVRSWVAIFG